ncbi:serine/threonine-protein kinase [Pseudonocardia alni]|uniref:Uncharacterized protein n=2 Tax=Pseudonocardia alni TaxID=33907 RepID=A0AA44UMI7_PSEA5|nr:hypothetical protein [Pseudonocardia alni]PKB29840.1 hypothetical protein ATL51_1486 [Pseudonocardia alni]
MTVYAHDPATSTLFACWPTGDGALAHRVARVPRNLSPVLTRHVVAALTVLSDRLWLAYSETTVQQIDRQRVTAAATHPDTLPEPEDRIGTDDLVEVAAALGEVLSAAPGRVFREAVLAEVRAELVAVAAADRGDLTGRAAQAVVHPRPDAPPGQVAAAHTFLHADPLDPRPLLTGVEPNAAAVAVLPWLRAATRVAAQRTGHTADDVVALAEAITHEDLAVVRHVLAATPGLDDPTVVHYLLQEAVLAARGRMIVCCDAHGEPVGDGRRLVETVLDPREPGPGLVGGLVRGIQCCLRVWLDGVPPDAVSPLGLRERFVDELRIAVGAIR